MVHPSLDRPILSSIQPMFAHLVHFENIPGLEDLQKRMIRYLVINFLNVRLFSYSILLCVCQIICVLTFC